MIRNTLKARLSILNDPFEQIDSFELKSLKSSFRTF